MIRDMLWKCIAKLVSQPAIAEWLIERSFHSPYTHIVNNGSDLYMGRWWLFNPYDRQTRKTKYKFFPWSVRIHFIARGDYEEHQHDHPWDEARTIILRGGYWEKRGEQIYWRRVGDTFLLDNNMFHKINSVSYTGAWTLFITKNFIGDWGFLVNGKKIPHKEYFALREANKL